MWKDCWLKYKEISETYYEEYTEEENFDDEGLGTKLIPKYKSDMKGSYKL